MSRKGQPRVALITGAAQGIGCSIALRLASDGFDVAINDLASNADNLSKVVEQVKHETGRRAVAILADVSEEDRVKEMVERVVKELGGLDVLVANAGIGKRGAIQDMSVAEWDQVMAVNLRSVFLCYKYGAHQMISQGKERGGRLIGASSLLGKQAMANSSAYAASKFAVRGLTQAAACEYGQYGITVNAYAPGWIETPMTVSEEVTGRKPGEFLQLIKQKSLVGYNGQPGDIAHLVSYLASKESHFMTGQSVSINGGLYFD